MKFLIISIIIVTISYVLSEVIPVSNDTQRISLETSNRKHNRNHYSVRRTNIKPRKHRISVARRKHVKTTTTINPNILNQSKSLYKLNIDYLPLPVATPTIKLPVLPIQNLSNQKPIEYDNDWTHWEIPKGQYFTVLQTLMIQRENIDLQIQHTFGLLNAERKLRDEPLLDHSDYSPCNKKIKNSNNVDVKRDKKPIITEEKKIVEKLMMNELNSAQIKFNEPVSGRLDCQCKVLKDENKKNN